MFSDYLVILTEHGWASEVSKHFERFVEKSVKLLPKAETDVNLDCGVIEMKRDSLHSFIRDILPMPRDSVQDVKRQNSH